MKISMIVAVYNIKKYISQCIESIISQTYTDFECILVDDGSTDGSGNICNEYAQMDSRIKVLHKKNEGLPQARKSGFDMSVGDYCLFVDGDDWLEKSMLECLIKSAELNSSDIVICDYYKAYDNRKKRVHYKIPSNKKKLMYSFVKRPDYLNFFWNKLLKRNLFVDFDISFPKNISLCEDLFVVYKLIYYAREISCVPVCLYNYRQDNRNSITKNMSEKRFQDKLYVFDDLQKFINKHLDKDEYQDLISYYKVYNKLPLIVNKKIRNAFLWESLYPEANKSIWKSPLRLDYKFLSWLGSKGLFKFAFFLQDLKRK